jgi:hypothetical protein
MVVEHTQALGVEKQLHACAATGRLHSAMADEPWMEQWGLRWICGGSRVGSSFLD